MSKHVNKFANMSGKQRQVTTSTELTEDLISKYKKGLGMAYTHTEEPMYTREELTAAAHAMPLLDLAKQVIHGSYTPGVEDVVLLDRLGDSAVSGQVKPLVVAFDE